MPAFPDCATKPVSCGQDGASISFANAGLHWVELVSLAGQHGAWEEICADDYGSFFAAGLEALAATCTDFAG